MNDKTIQELREWGDKRPGTSEGYSAFLEWGTEFQEILSRAEQEAKDEPLAVLANRKGYGLIEILTPADEIKNTYSILLDHGAYVELQRCFEDKDCAVAEAKARAYLNGLPDKEDGK